MQIVDPVGLRTDAASAPSRRPHRLQGLRLGLLHNGKPGGEHLLDRVGDRLRDEHALGAVATWRKPHPSARATFLDEVARDCDVVVGALSD